MHKRPQLVPNNPITRKKRTTGEWVSLTEGIVRACKSYSGAPVTKEAVRHYKNLFDNEYHIAAAVMLEGHGLARKHATFFGPKREHDELTSHLSIVPKDANLFSPSEIMMIFGSVPNDRWAALSKRLKEIDGWLRLIPKELDQKQRIELATFIGRVAEPPNKKEDICEKLNKSEEEVLRILVSENVDSQVLDDYDRFVEYAREILTPEVTRSDSGTFTAIAPHEQIQIPSEVASHLQEQGISPEDVIRMLVYGLKLNSPKAARGGKYFPTEKFRQYSESALESNGREIPKRRAEVETFLLRHGVIATYKQGDVMRLNIKDDSQSTTPTDIGQRILNTIISWMNRFQRETAISAS
jgi:hypothetical protein